MVKSFRIAILTIFVISLAAGAEAQTEDDIIKVDSSLVVLNASITDANGKFPNSLKKDLFKIFEDGVEQQISFFAAEDTPFAAVILLDVSGSMEGRVTLVRAAAIRFLDGLRPTDNVAIYAFDSKLTSVQPFSNSRDVRETLFDLKANGQTILNDAVYEAAAQLANRPEKRRAIVVLSDGMDTLSKRSVEKALTAASSVNAVVYTVDMSSPDSPVLQKIKNQAILQKFAARTGGTFIATPGGAALRDAFQKIVDELGRQYTLGYQPINSKKDGKWRKLELRVQRPNLTIRTRQGYFAVDR